MVLLKNLAVSMLLRNNVLNIRNGVMRENLSLARYLQVRNLVFNTVKSPNFRGVDKRFCTHLREVSNENSAEDLLEDVGEVKNKDDENDTETIFEEIADGDEDVLKKLKLLELEVSVLREEECRVPDLMRKSSWEDLLEMPTLTKRKKYLAFLRLNELKNLSEKRKGEGKRELLMKRREELGPHYYGLSGHTMFMRVYDRNVKKLLHIRSLKSKLQIVLDCSYQDYMSNLNVRACAKQIFMCLTEAKTHRYPCQLKLFNFNRNDALGKTLPQYMCGVYEQNTVDIHSESYLDVYPKDKLVYLTPHSSAPLKVFNPDDIYIIGAFIDKGTGVKASLAKAKENKLRMYKLPIDEYINWKKGTKSLPLNVVLSILLDMAFYNDWNKAFQNLPSRCCHG